MKERLSANRNEAMKRFTAGMAASQYPVMKILNRYMSTGSLSTLLASLDQLEKTDARSLLSVLAGRLHILLGDEDKLVPVKLGTVLLRCYPALRLCYVNGGGHAFFLSHLQQAAAFIEESVQRNEESGD